MFRDKVVLGYRVLAQLQCGCSFSCVPLRVLAQLQVLGYRVGVFYVCVLSYSGMRAQYNSVQCNYFLRKVSVLGVIHLKGELLFCRVSLYLCS